MTYASSTQTNDAAETGFGSRRVRLASARTILASAFMIALCSLESVPATAAAETSRSTAENHACAVVLGLNPSEAGYAACVQSLERSLASTASAQANIGGSELRMASWNGFIAVR